jgi:hypothetical protein
MVRTHTGDFALDVLEAFGARGGATPTRPRGTAPTSPSPPPPLVSIEKLLAMQNELMQVLTKNLMHQGGRQPHHQPVLDFSYTDFLVMHPPMFAEVFDLLEVDN